MMLFPVRIPPGHKEKRPADCTTGRFAPPAYGGSPGAPTRDAQIFSLPLCRPRRGSVWRERPEPALSVCLVHRVGLEPTRPQRTPVPETGAYTGSATCADWWGKMDLNHRRQRRRVYSPLPLTTRTFPRMWWVLQGSNLGRAELRSAALPAELRIRVGWVAGLEPAASGATTRRSDLSELHSPDGCRGGSRTRTARRMRPLPYR